MEFEFYDLLEVIRHRAGSIAIGTAAVVLATGLISFLLFEPKYEATTTLLIQPKNMANSINYDELIANEKLVPTYAAIIKSRKMAEDVIGQTGVEMTVDELLKHIKVQEIKDSLVTAVTITDANPDSAVLIANSYAQSFQTWLPEIMKVENIAILDKAKKEAQPKPVSPKPYLYMLLAGVIALNAGVLLAVLLESRFRTLTPREDIETELGLPVLATVPKYAAKGAVHRDGGRRKRLFCIDFPKSPMAEAYRTLRTNIRYFESSSEIKTLLVTSAVPGEGKTSTAANLAAALAQEGKRVLLVDADLRRGKLASVLDSNAGLVGALIREKELDQLIERRETFDVLAGEVYPHDPSELLGSDGMLRLVEKLKKVYDTVIFDSPPLLAVADAQILAGMADATVLVVRIKGLWLKNAKQAASLLQRTGARTIGAVVNRQFNHMKAYSSYYG